MSDSTPAIRVEQAFPLTGKQISDARIACGSADAHKAELAQLVLEFATELSAYRRIEARCYELAVGHVDRTEATDLDFLVGRLLRELTVAQNQLAALRADRAQPSRFEKPCEQFTIASLDNQFYYADLCATCGHFKKDHAVADRAPSLEGEYQQAGGSGRPIRDADGRLIGLYDTPVSRRSASTREEP